MKIDTAFLNKIKIFFIGLGYIFLYFILSIGLQDMFYNDISNKTNPFLSNAAMIFTDLIVLLIFIIIFRKTLIPDYYDFKKNFKNYLKNNYHYWLIGLGIMIITNNLINIVFNKLPSNETNNIQFLEAFPISAIISFLIFAPIIEELITKVMFKKSFKNEYIFIIFAGLIFGSLHILSANSIIECLYIIPYGALSCAFAKMYSKTNNIWTGIFFHSMHNLLALIIIIIGG